MNPQDSVSQDSVFLTCCGLSLRYLFLAHFPDCNLGFGGYRMISLVAQLVKNPPAMQETWIQSLG